MKVVLRALQFFRPDIFRLSFVFAFMVLGVLAGMLKPWPIAIIIDCVLGGKPVPSWLQWAISPNRPDVHDAGGLYLLLASVLLLHLVHAGLSTAQNYISIRIGLDGLYRARNEVFACLQRLSLRFFKGAKAGDLIYRSVWDTYSIQTLFQQGVVAFVSSILTVVLMLCFMASINLRLTFTAVLIMPFLVAAIRIFGKRMAAEGGAAQQADSNVASLVQQSVTTLPLVQSYTREEEQQKLFVAGTANARERRLKQHQWELYYGLAVTIVYSFGITAILWIGSLQVIEGRLTVGQLWIFLAYMAQLYEPLNQLSHVGSTLATASGAAARVFELLDMPEDIKDAPDALPVVRESSKHPAGGLVLRGGIELCNVTFGYEPGRPVLQKMSFHINPGERVAVIGPSGAGKTTLMNLLPRFYDPTGGVVKFDGMDLKRLKIKDLRSHVAVVQQEPILLSATVAENIGYGKPGSSLEEIKTAAHAAHALEFIERLPDKFSTVVGEGGWGLSAGERQRINIARAFLKNAPIVLMDEPTCALDAEAEKAVADGLDKLMLGRTTLIIAHRLTTVRGADKVIVLDQGRMVEQGTPAELLKKQDGYFARMSCGQLKMG